jgi:mono/diheme cytochrome c family protein
MAAKVANLHEARFGADQYPDGKVYHVITHGQGLMSGYGANIPVRDRWAIVAYLRALQESKKADADAPVDADAPADAKAPADADAPENTETAGGASN